jgi:hypothetical protein
MLKHNLQDRADISVMLKHNLQDRADISVMLKHNLQDSLIDFDFCLALGVCQ